MKKLISLISFFLLINTISFAQNIVVSCNYNDSIFKLLPNEMGFDVHKHRVETMTGDYTILFDNKNYKSYFFKTSGSIYYKQINKKINVYKVINYYYDGKIESVDLYYTPNVEDSGVNIGISKTFDKNYTLTEEKNYDKGYKICYNEVIPILNKLIGERFIKKYEIEIYAVSRVDLNENPTLKPKWYVSIQGNDAYHKKIKKAHGATYIFDGITGKFLNKRTFKSGY